MMPEKGDDPGGTGDMVVFVFGTLSSAPSTRSSAFLRPCFFPLRLGVAALCFPLVASR